MRGDVQGIMDYTQRLEKMDEKLSEFAQYIYDLAKQLKFKEIRKIIKQCMDKP